MISKKMKDRKFVGVIKIAQSPSGKNYELIDKQSTVINTKKNIPQKIK